MKQDPALQRQAPTMRFRAKVIALRETFVKVSAALDMLGHAQQRADGRWAVPAALTPEQLEPLVAAGATVVLEQLMDPCLPKDRIMPHEQAVAEAEHVVQVLTRRSADASAPGEPDV
jgi:hypothetical protein